MRALRSIAALLLSSVVGCGPGPLTPDAGVDAFLASDAGRDAPATDAPTASDVGLDAPATVDAGADAAVSDAGSDARTTPDAPLCPTCEVGFVRGGLLDDAFASVVVDGAGHVVVGGRVTEDVDLGCGRTPVAADRGHAVLATFDGTGACLEMRVLGTGTAESEVRQLLSGPDGSLVVVGSALGMIDLGGGPLAPIGPQDTFVARYDAGGALAWGRRFGGTDGVGVASAAIDGDVIVLAGSFSGTADFGDRPLTAGSPSSTFVVVLDQAGATRWSAAYGSGRIGGAAVALDGEGGLFVAGGFGGSIDLGGGALSSTSPAPDVFVASLAASDGAHRWSHRYGDAGTQVATGIAVTASGSLIVAGGFDGTIDFGGGMLTSTAPTDAFVATLSAASGAHERSLALVGTGDQLTGTILPLTDGFVLSGALHGATDFAGGTTPTSGVGGFLARFDAAGALVTARYYGAAARTTVTDVAVYGSGFVAVGATQVGLDFGAGASPVRGIADAFLVFPSSP